MSKIKHVNKSGVDALIALVKSNCNNKVEAAALSASLAATSALLAADNVALMMSKPALSFTLAEVTALRALIRTV